MLLQHSLFFSGVLLVVLSSLRQALCHPMLDSEVCRISLSCCVAFAPRICPSPVVIVIMLWVFTASRL